MEIVEDRHGQGSTLITSQLPVAARHDVIDEPTFADAILDRLVHNAYRLDLDGHSMHRFSQAQATEQSLAHSSPEHSSAATSRVFGASTFSRSAWWLLAVHQKNPMPYDCRPNPRTIPCNDCPPSRGIPARHPVEQVPVIAWNTHVGHVFAPNEPCPSWKNVIARIKPSPMSQVLNSGAFSTRQT
jgi:IstB-like ATP binding protein